MNEPYLFKNPVFVEVDDMVEPNQRFMSMNIDEEMVDELIEHYEDHERINRAIIARTIGRGVGLSEECTAPRLGRNTERLNIRRFRFYLMVVEDEPTRSMPGKAYIVTGFTSEIDDADLNGVTANTDMHINSIIELRSKLVRGRRDDEMRYDINKMNVIQRKDSSTGRRSKHHNARVSDILTIYGVAQAGELDLKSGRDDDVVVSAVSFGRRTATTCTWSDQCRAGYVKRLVDADRLGMAQTRTYSDIDYSDDYESAAIRRFDSAANEFSNATDLSRSSGLISWLSARSVNVKSDMTFKYEDLIDLVPVRKPTIDDLDDMTDIISICDENDISYYSQEFYGKSSKMRSVAIMCQEIPTFMSEALLTRIEFSVDNETLDRDGNPEYAVNDFDQVFEIDGIEDMVDLFVRRFISEVYLNATNDNKRFMRLNIACVAGGLVEITMEYDGNDPEEFRYPAFMAGVLSNNTSYSAADTHRLANQYGRVSQDFITRVVFNDELDEDEIDRRITSAFED